MIRLVLALTLSLCCLSVLALNFSERTGFIENKGQIIDQNYDPNPTVLYLLHLTGMNVQLRKGGFSYDLYQQQLIQNSPSNIESTATRTNYHRIDLDLLGCNPNCMVVTSGQYEEYFNYYTSGTTAEGIMNVRLYQTVTYENIYPGIDLQFHSGRDQTFEYDFIIKPGADVSLIRIKISGAEKIRSNSDGIFYNTSIGKMEETIPFCYYKLYYKTVPVKGKFKKQGDQIYGLVTEQNIPKNAILVIDPVPIRHWGTYFGNTGVTKGRSSVDNYGNIILCGLTYSTTNIATSGAYQVSLMGEDDAFLSKFSPDGQRIWSTYYGGSLIDEAYMCKADRLGNVIMVGHTLSTNNIASPGGYQTNMHRFQDGFIVKFNSGGQRIWASYYGGNETQLNVSEDIQSCDVDTSGNIYFSGRTTSPDFISSSGAHQENYGGLTDCFLVKFSPDGQRLWGTYYGGNNKDDVAFCTVTKDGFIYLTGNTQSSDNIATPGSFLPTYNGFSKAFLAAFNSQGQRLWGTYYGGENQDWSNGCVSDTNTNVYICGGTFSSTNIATPGVFQQNPTADSNGYLAKFNSSGQRIWGTYYGSKCFMRSIAVNDSGYVFITGEAYIQNSIFATPGAFQHVFRGLYDTFLAKFSSDGTQRIWGTYYGGTGYDLGYVAVDHNQNIYLSGNTTSINNTNVDTSQCTRRNWGNYISTPGSYQNELMAFLNVFLVKFSDCSSPDTATQINGPSGVCVNSTNAFSIDPIPGTIDYHWCVSGNLTIASGQGTTNIIVNVGPTIGVDTISVYGINACGEGFPKFLAVQTNRRPLPIIAGPDTICSGDTAVFITTGGKTNYVWNISSGGSIISGGTTTDSTASVIWSTGGNQWISLEYLEDGCPPMVPFQKNVWINGGPAMDVTITVSQNPVCSPTSVTFTAIPSGTGALTYDWKVNGASQGVNNPTFNYTPANGDVVTCVLSSSITTCVTNNPATSNSITMVVTPVTVLAVNISPSVNPSCSGNPVTFTAVPSVTGPTNVFAWKVNGVPVGTNQTTYSYNPVNGDVITCQLSSSEQCVTGSPANSNSITMSVGTSQVVGVSITASNNAICAGNSVTFTATPVNPGATPVYLWKVNGISQGSNNATFIYVPANGDVVTCTLNSSIPTCLSNNPATSNQIIMQVNPIVPVSISVTPSQNNICAGTQVTFAASPSGQGTTPVYSWKVNGSPVGTSQLTYSYIPSNNDIVTCILTSSEQCPSQSSVTSAPVQMIVNPNLIVSVGISASINPVCAGIPVTFTANPVNGGLTPSYQWKVNGGNAGTNQNNYTYLPVNGDVVTCSMTTSISSCASPTTSTANPITMVISPLPVVTYTICTDSITTTNARPIKLKGGIPLGGTYSGPGVNSVTGVFSPAIAGAGIKAITYSYTNAGMCSANKIKNIIVQVPAAFVCGNPFTDIRDNKVYQTIQIGSQCWFSEDLDYGVIISQNQHQRDNCVTEKYLASSIQHLASVYQWDEVMEYSSVAGEKGLCPAGWHVPTEAEWQILFNTYSGIAFAAGPLKYSGFSGFNGTLNGFIPHNTTLLLYHFATFYWTSTAYGLYKAWAHGMNEPDPSVSSYPAARQDAFGVRCVKD